MNQLLRLCLIGTMVMKLGLMIGSFEFGYTDDFSFKGTDLGVTKNMFSAEDILAVLTAVGIRWQDIADKNFYLSTHQIPNRHILDLPLHKMAQRSSFSIIPVYSTINRLYCSKNDDYISAYVGLANKSLLEAIRSQVAAVSAIQESYYVDTDKIFSILKDTYIEQRRLGLILHYIHYCNAWMFGLSVPLEYHERNFQMSSANKLLLKHELELSDSNDDFEKKHLISDKLGFSDIRPLIGYRWSIDHDINVSVQLFSTLPTAFVINKGFAGSSYARPHDYPQIKVIDLFDHLFDQGNTDEQISTLKVIGNLGLDALDRLSANVLDLPLGNNKHASFGVSFSSDYVCSLDSLARDMRAVCNFSCSSEFFLPRSELRFFVNDVDLQTFAHYDFNDYVNAAEKLQFLSNQTIERYFLRARLAKVTPGVVLRGQMSAELMRYAWRAMLGMDCWVKLQDKVKLHDFDTFINQSKAQGFTSYQCGIFGNIMYDFSSVSLGVYGFGTLFTQAIGKEYGLGIECSIAV